MSTLLPISQPIRKELVADVKIKRSHFQEILTFLLLRCWGNPPPCLRWNLPSWPVLLSARALRRKEEGGKWVKRNLQGVPLLTQSLRGNTKGFFPFYLFWVLRIKLENCTRASWLKEQKEVRKCFHQKISFLDIWVIKSYQTWVQSAKEGVESLWRTVRPFVCVTKPLQGRDTETEKEFFKGVINHSKFPGRARLISILSSLPDATVKGTRSERHPVAHVSQYEVSFHLSVQCNICHTEENYICLVFMHFFWWHKCTKKQPIVTAYA